MTIFGHNIMRAVFKWRGNKQDKAAEKNRSREDADGFTAARFP